jgi:glycosyltransferase involved in cell wall biosynthesis
MPRLLGFTTSRFDPASRFRFIQFIPYLQELGWNVAHRPNVPDRQWSSPLGARIPRAFHHRAARLLMKYNRLRDLDEARAADVVFVNRDLAGPGSFFGRRLLKRNSNVLFDFDDAIFIGRNEPAVAWMCQSAAWITPGNEYLAAYARQHSDSVTVIPTVIDTDSYAVRNRQPPPNIRPRVGWSGSDQSIRQALFPFLPLLADIQRKLQFELVVITNTRPKFPDCNLNWSFVPWTETEELQLSSKIDIGIMPLVDDEFQRGKCGLKLLQYMAAGLPTIASPVGVNADITELGITGFLPRTESEWAENLTILVNSPELRLQMGRAGRNRCVRDYSIQTWLPRIDQLLRALVNRKHDNKLCRSLCSKSRT